MTVLFVLRSQEWEMTWALNYFSWCLKRKCIRCLRSDFQRHPVFATALFNRPQGTRGTCTQINASWTWFKPCTPTPEETQCLPRVSLCLAVAQVRHFPRSELELRSGLVYPMLEQICDYAVTSLTSESQNLHFFMFILPKHELDLQLLLCCAQKLYLCVVPGLTLNKKRSSVLVLLVADNSLLPISLLKVFVLCWLLLSKSHENEHWQCVSQTPD